FSSINPITCLMRSLEYSKPPATELEHLGHEWEPVKSSSTIERHKDLFPTPNFDPVSRSQLHLIALGVLLGGLELQCQRQKNSWSICLVACKYSSCLSRVNARNWYVSGPS